MHYRNGREAKPGDRIVNLVTGLGGLLYATVASSETCNGRLAIQRTDDPYVTIGECVHVDDVAAAFPKIAKTEP
jgi:hypothetical protein